MLNCSPICRYSLQSCVFISQRLWIVEHYNDRLAGDAERELDGKNLGYPYRNYKSEDDQDYHPGLPR